MADGANKLPAGFSVGDTLASRYVLKRVINPDNGEAALFVCEYDDFPFLAKVYFPGKEPSAEKTEKEKSMNSPYLVKKSDRFTCNGCSCEIMPFFNKADLISSGKAVNDKRLFETIIPNVNEALKVVHDSGLTHGNVKPTNIFYSPFGPDQVLLGDLGVDLANISEFTKQTGFAFLPPENLKGIFGKEADYWSLGITLVMLVTGRGVFDGLNRKQMLKKAATYDLEIPDKASDKLKNIIRGLTVKDYKTRWGYDEIKKCLAGEDVPIVDEYVYEPPTDVYQFDGVPVKGLENIAQAFAQNWSAAVSCVGDPALLEIVDNYAEDKFPEVVAICKNEDKDRALFDLISILNPSLPPYWKGQEIGDIAQFANEMAIAYDKDPFLDSLRSGIVSLVAQQRGMDSSVVDKIKSVEQEAAEGGGNEEMIAYKLNYYVSGDYTYDFRNTPCKSVADLVQYIRANVDNLDSICAEFIDDTRFFAWLEVLGYSDEVKKWRAAHAMY
ncbi:MAG: protein kinase [Firmicutes bacterium]|nr:protein kinase [Bacillota bacterium]